LTFKVCVSTKEQANFKRTTLHKGALNPGRNISVKQTCYLNSTLPIVALSPNVLFFIASEAWPAFMVKNPGQDIPMVSSLHSVRVEKRDFPRKGGELQCENPVEMEPVSESVNLFGLSDWDFYTLKGQLIKFLR